MKNELKLFKSSENAFPVDFGTCLKPKLRFLVKTFKKKAQTASNPIQKAVKSFEKSRKKSSGMRI